MDQMSGAGGAVGTPVARVRTAVAPWPVVGALAALGLVAVVGVAASRWFATTRVDLDPDRRSGLVLAVLALVPLAVPMLAVARRVPLPVLAPVAVAGLALPGAVVAFAWPRVVEASATDTTLEVGPAPTVLVAAAVAAVVASVAATRRRGRDERGRDRR